MNNFGVYELASAKTTSAPGWAYVPDTGVNPAAAALQPANRKRAARTKANPSASDLNVRQEAKIRKELEALDKDWGRDATIPIPAKGGSRGELLPFQVNRHRRLTTNDQKQPRRKAHPTSARSSSPKRHSQTTSTITSPTCPTQKTPPRRTRTSTPRSPRTNHPTRTNTQSATPPSAQRHPPRNPHPYPYPSQKTSK